MVSVSGFVGKRCFSTEVTAAMVKELRALSGAPLLDCKQALAHETVQGDQKKAMDWLRAKGLKKFAQSQRVTNEGLLAAYIQPHRVSLVEVNCETGKSIVRILE
ncbi:hypothetical protein EON65_19700 [archaeon]|nr:MAG: hypothetical protein EON65_19700 [archaeon]